MGSFSQNDRLFIVSCLLRGSNHSKCVDLYLFLEDYADVIFFFFFFKKKKMMMNKEAKKKEATGKC